MSYQARSYGYSGDAQSVEFFHGGERYVNPKRLTDDEFASLISRVREGSVRALRFRARVFGDAPNANLTRPAPGILEDVAETAVGAPFLRDHSKKSEDRIGSVVAAYMQDHDEIASLTVEIDVTEPSDQERFLRGQIDRFSIGLSAEKAFCSICGTSCAVGVYGPMPSCEHRPGRKYESFEQDVLAEVFLAGVRIEEVSSVTMPAYHDTTVLSRYWVENCRSQSVFKEVDPVDTPIYDDESWDGDAAVAALREWAGGDDIDFEKYAKGFAVIDGDPENLASYKFPHHVLVDGEFYASRAGVMAAWTAANGARSGERNDEAIAHLKVHMDRIRGEQEEESQESGSEQQYGKKLAELLNSIIEKRPEPREDTVKKLSAASGHRPQTVNEVLTGRLKCLPLDRMRAYAKTLGVDVGRLKKACEADGCVYGNDKKESQMSEETKEVLVEQNFEEEKARMEVELSAAREQTKAMFAMVFETVFENAVSEGRAVPADREDFLMLFDANVASGGFDGIEKFKAWVGRRNPNPTFSRVQIGGEGASAEVTEEKEDHLALARIMARNGSIPREKLTEENLDRVGFYELRFSS